MPARRIHRPVVMVPSAGPSPIGGRKPRAFPSDRCRAVGQPSPFSRPIGWPTRGTSSRIPSVRCARPSRRRQSGAEPRGVVSPAARGVGQESGPHPGVRSPPAVSSSRGYGDFQVKEERRDVQRVGAVAPCAGLRRMDFRHEPLHADAGVHNDCTQRSRSSRSRSALSLKARPDAARRL